MKTALITGATSGIGFAVCRALLALDYHIIGIGRTQSNCKVSQAQLLSEFPNGSIAFFHGDMMQQRDVHRIADEAAEYVEKHCEGRLNVLINNAGCVRGRYSVTEDGIEQQFALNHLAGFLLTYRLLDYIKRCGGRIINTSSFAHEKAKVRWNDIMHKKFYFIFTVYKQTKLCNLLFAHGLNRRYDTAGIKAYAVNPGLVATDIGSKHTSLLVKFVWSTIKARGVPPEVPAQTYAYLCETQPAPEGLYFNMCKSQPYSKEVNDTNAARLFEISERLCNIKY